MQLEPLLQCFFIFIVIRAGLDDNGVTAFTDFAVLFPFGLRFPLRLSFKSRRGGQDKDVLLHITLQH